MSLRFRLRSCIAITVTSKQQAAGSGQRQQSVCRLHKSSPLAVADSSLLRFNQSGRHLEFSVVTAKNRPLHLISPSLGNALLEMPGNERLKSPRSRLNIGTFQAIHNRLGPCFPGQTTEALEAAAEDAKGIVNLLLSIDEGKDVAPVVIKLLNGDDELRGAGTLRVARNPICAVAVLAWQLSKGRRVNLDDIVGPE
jgi:hypothetical protein